ncbi:MAG: 4-alpha-glucanotransferase [Candidatus Korobacteraceae bacterium]|jgi:4-alpha-glucanotransferase
MSFPRSSGILLHPTSLPSAYGIGELGPEAHRFADFLRDAGRRIWQVLPLGPTGYGDSPYQCFSAFAGKPLLISLDTLVARGYLDSRQLDSRPRFPAGQVAAKAG